jgi:hypothetical protein
MKAFRFVLLMALLGAIEACSSRSDDLTDATAPEMTPRPVLLSHQLDTGACPGIYEKGTCRLNQGRTGVWYVNEPHCTQTSPCKYTWYIADPTLRLSDPNKIRLALDSPIKEVEWTSTRSTDFAVLVYVKIRGADGIYRDHSDGWVKVDACTSAGVC